MIKNGKVIVTTRMNELPTGCFFCDYFQYDDAYGVGKCLADGADTTNIYKEDFKIKRQRFCPLKIIE